MSYNPRHELPNQQELSERQVTRAKVAIVQAAIRAVETESESGLAATPAQQLLAARHEYLADDRRRRGGRPLPNGLSILGPTKNDLLKVHSKMAFVNLIFSDSYTAIHYPELVGTVDLYAGEHRPEIVDSTTNNQLSAEVTIAPPEAQAAV